ncbi:DUF87 domain-containing protein [Sporosarcina sp. Sa2YVA2]|uniref:DUF87 domain-containing protein n=2 Tax=Sporosarcina quadrami TaxID=2762234 RepID=A0ABR8U8H5_9BACL|nr:DUF87 domain-containing protein [Sporosarcina quadrami]
MMNRMFETDRTEEKIETENKVHTNDMESHEQNERPAFRFPIITDAEIYGWDTDTDEAVKETVETRATKELVTELDDEFEPVPLYKNDRWPVKNEKVTIHRATSRPRYEEKIGIRPAEPVPTIEKRNDEVRETIIKKRNNRPFTPTQVPSPVYGLSKPVSFSKSTDPLSANKSLKNKVETEKNDFSEEIQRIEPENLVHTTVIEVETKIPEETTQHLINECTTSELPASEKKFESVGTELVNQNDTEQVATGLEEKIGLTQNEESPLVIEQDVNKEFDEQIEQQETSVSDQQVPPKTEKIVPFNVLMLKNDKANYEQRMKTVTQKKTASPVADTHEIIANTDDNNFVKRNPEVEQVIMSERTATMSEEQIEDELETQPYYAFPPKDFLVQPEEHIEDTEWLQTQSEKLEEALSYFAVQANVIEAVQGPTVTRFELTVGHGTKVSKIRNLTDDLKLALAAEDIRIQAPIPGTSSIGIEIPNRKPRAVRISEVIGTRKFQESVSPLEAVLGLSLTGEPVTLDLRKMPHGMIAGATGSGKSVCINSILISLLYKSAPTDLKMLLIDPKMVELAPYNGIPHLLSPVITDVKAATAALKWAVGEMERRYELFAHVGARNIERYNEMAEKDRKFSLKLPYLLIVIDELADLMMMAPADVEVSISRITQKARACGIHLIIATQRPSVDVITGTIKANVPTRIAFSVSSQIDSRTIIDTPGAERLLGKGDMLYLGNGQSSPIRLQGTFVTDQEIERIIQHVQNEADPDYLFGQEDLLATIIDEEEADPLFIEACRFIIEQGSASTSLLQRNFSIGYNRAAKLMDRMEKLGFISEQKGSKAREVFLTDSNFEQFLNGSEQTN